MNTHEHALDTNGFSMRRTVLTLLGAFAAFGILTASYATAELPAASETGLEQVIVVE